jgi:hypothetical protein
MRAWWVYWGSIALALALWTGASIVAGPGGLREVVSQPVWLAILLLPLGVAGVDLILYRERHEEVCRVEAERHAWLRVLVGRGYSARTFLWSGLALLALVGFIVFSAITGRL